jgi:hypothetical protein
MHIVAALVLIVLLASCGAAFVLSLRKVVPSDVKRHQTNAQRALELHPATRAKVEEDRRWDALRFQQQMAYEKQQAEMALRRDEFVLKAWQTQTLISPETYILDHEPAQLTALPALKRIESKDQEQDTAQLPEAIPAIVRYADIRDEVPPGMSLLGIHPSNGELELSDWEKLKMLWIIGSSSTGKSNTVFGKALEAVNHGARLLVVDQHAAKEDSLTRKLEPLKASFLRSVAVSDEQVLSAIDAFKSEFDRRVHNAPCTQKIVLIMDEINRMARNDALLAAIKEVVAIGGEESRGFCMYVWAISQKAVYLKWLRDSAITVIAHRVTRMEEAKLACNDDLKAARKLLTFPVGRSFIYGVDFDDLIELQQPLYDAPVVEGTISAAVSEDISELSPREENGYSNGDSGEQGGKQLDTPSGILLDQAQKMKLLQVLELDAQQKGQNDIIRTIWGQEPNTRQGQAAAEELRLIRAFIAQDQRRKLGL